MAITSVSSEPGTPEPHNVPFSLYSRRYTLPRTNDDCTRNRSTSPSISMASLTNSPTVTVPVSTKCSAVIWNTLPAGILIEKVPFSNSDVEEFSRLDTSLNIIPPERA